MNKMTIIATISHPLFHCSAVCHCLAVNTPAIMAHLQSRYFNRQQELALDSTREWAE